MRDFDKTNRLFESNKNPFKLVDDLVNLVESVGKSIISENLRHRVNIFQTEDLTSYLDPTPNFGFSCEERFKKMKKRFKDSGDKREGEQIVFDIRFRCKKFTLALIKELKNRIPDNYQVLRMIKEFSVENVLRQIKPKITDLFNLPELHENLTNEDVDRLEQQWENVAYVKWDREVI